MIARSQRDWERLGSEAQCADAESVARGQSLACDSGPAGLESFLAHHFSDDLDSPEITPDREMALDALVRGYRKGA